MESDISDFAIKSKNERFEAIRAAGQNAISWYTNQLVMPHGSGDCDTVSIVDPCHNKDLWTIPNCDDQTVAACINKARLAQPEWAKTSAAHKSHVLNLCADAIEQKLDILAEVLALETGKALTTETSGEVTLPPSIFRYFAGLTHELKGETIQMSPTLMGFTTYHPWGVVAGIVPWNVPLMFMAYKVASSIASGNAVVIKMPEQGSAALAIIYREILPLLPNGLVSFVSGTGQQAGKALVSNPEVDKISFTGSVETGTQIEIDAAESGKSVTLELGGKSPMIILDDCDESVAIEGILQSMRFTRAGQSCTASSRIFVPKQKLLRFKEKLKQRLSELVIGDPLDPETECGPVVSKKQKAKILNYIEMAKCGGFEIVEAGNVANQEQFQTGCFVRPHIIVQPDQDHPVSTEEIFGPVVTLNSYDTIDDAIAAANNTQYGLAASVWGKNIQQCMQCAANFRAGIVQINQNAIMLPGFSYGGIKKSGTGIESSLEAMLSCYMYKKTTILNFDEATA